MKNTKNYMTSHKYSIQGVILTIPLITKYINLFWKDIFSKLDIGQLIFLIMVLKLSDGSYRSINYMSKLSYYNKEEFTEKAISRYNIHLDNYSDKEIIAVDFRYRLISPEDLIDDMTIIHDAPQPESKVIATTQYKGTKLPNTMDFWKWGTIVSNNNNNLKIISTINNIKYEYHLTINSKGHNVSLYSNNNFILKFTDIRNEGGFTRTIDSMEYHYKNDQLVAKTHNKHFKYIKGISKDKSSDIKIITMDIETRTINNIMIPYSICYFNGKEKFSYYLSDFNSVDDMLTTCIKSLFTVDYKDHLIYIHNLSKFDAVFLLKVLAKLTKENDNLVSIIKRESSIITINLHYKININNKSVYCSLYFRDSLLTLTGSLRNLAKSFKVEDKSIFPYNFVNDSNIPLTYIGPVPDFKYFSDITLEQYIEYCKDFNNNNWDLRKETIKYCEQDCITLYQVINKFNSIIYSIFKITLKFYPTLPSLAFGIFRNKFYGELEKVTKQIKGKSEEVIEKVGNITKIVGDAYDFIRKSYTGGAVDVYIPRPIPKGSKVYAYDVNSLYPTVMSRNKMPIGKPVYFELIKPISTINDLTELDNLYNKKFSGRAFGFFNVEITTPDNLENPIIQTRVKTNEGYRTMAPLGTWNDVIFSEEMYNAMIYGYKFKIFNGYFFDTGYIFDNYISEIYHIKENSTKDNPMYLIAKLLLNGLYGRFGMNYKLEEHLIINNEKLDEYILDYVISNFNINLDIRINIKESK